ncbi:TAT-variant-translocated molybdopterin oxidoreductase [Capnocytophaga stomatis]|uniref:TAT-variant-translocated molybdopterin oxidoreductase n=1 Tax=Capnocytophaga stomatis TaxID=1848904 RepID=UPI001AC2ABBB|nr:TAT-variant-translocated molybdopterin oxidoreductase [Capnocytophaga stomatis]GIM48694.1 quinol:cytochrome C oxidoreductase [Capnocytophaga stomatis]
MASNKKYWKSVEELNENSVFDTLKQNEFVEEIPVDEFLGDKATLESSSTSRRDFLKYVGFTTAAATLAACEGPVHKAVPYVVLPEQIRPGVADYYATTIADGFDFASILVKTREGRPILIEHNREAQSHSDVNARVMASVLGLYDNLRVKNPMAKGGASVSWADLDSQAIKALEKATQNGKQIVILSHTLASLSSYKLIEGLKEKFPTLKLVEYDTISEEATLTAFAKKYGVRAMADYDFAKADVIVSFGADFIADWQGGGFEGGYAKGRIPVKGKMSRHIQFEANMTLSGANADKRVPVTPSQQKVALAKFYGYLNGVSVSGNLPENVEEAVKKAAAQVKKAGRKAVVVTGIQDENAQLLVLDINEKLQSEAFNPQTAILTRKGNVSELKQLISDMNNGNVGVLIINNLNPLYTLSNADEFAKALEKVDFSVSFSMKADETAIKTSYIAAAPHYLESWGDVELKRGHYALTQPTIRPLFDTRQLQDALLKWSGSEKTYYDFIKESWTTDILGSAKWNQALHDGSFVKEGLENIVSLAEVSVNDAVQSLSKATSNGFELTLYSKIGIGDGQQANNPWLQELPDPITRTTWDNYITMSAADAKQLGIKNWHVATGALDGNYAKVTVNGVSLTAPVLIQPGQAKGSIGLAFGYGRVEGMKKEMQVGVSAYPLYHNFDNVQNVESLTKADGTHEFACIQLHNTLMGRGDILKETTLEEFNSKPAEEWNKKPVVSLDHKEVLASSVSLWESFDRSSGHHFNLSIDLNACTGCGACVIACHAENNVPVVGKEEVRRSRDMHWLRIDRYYSSDDTFAGDLKTKEGIKGLSAALSTYGEMEVASENPQVAFQPVMCQHCNNAPCETVCPVAATSHGRQGQNHMAYNRCVGTRYCANNCPYKVRRFNWFLYNNNDEFDFHMNNDLGKMVLNPDVVVRSRGVMEKCSFCIQQTQAVILKAKNEGREVREGEFNNACACSAACGTGAMVFGDINEKNSDIAKLVADDRAYHLLEHIGTRPNVVYQVKVRNTQEV